MSKPSLHFGLVSQGIPELWDSLYTSPCVMSEVQFGSLTPDEYITLVRSRFETLGAMDGEPIPEDFFANAGMDVDSDDLDLLDDDYDPALSPDALAREKEPAAEAVIEEPTPVSSLPPPVSVPTVVEPVRPTEVAPAFTEKEEQKGVTDYLRSCHRDRAVLFDGVHDSDKKSVQEAWRHTQNAVRAACALSQRHSNMAKVMFLQAHLSERPLNLFIEEVGKWSELREQELKKPSPDPKFQPTLPPYEQVCAVIEREFLAGQRQSMLELTESLFHTKLYMLAEKYGGKSLPTLAQIWQDYKAMFRERASPQPGEGEFDKFTQIFLYLNAIPSNMYAVLRHVKDGNGLVKEPNDPIMLENSILAMGDQFLIDLKKRKENKIGKGSLPGPSRPSGSGAGPSGSGAGGSLASPDRKRPHKASFDKGKGKQLQSGGGNKKPFRPSHTF